MRSARSKKQEAKPSTPSDEYFKHVAEMYSEIMKSKDISGPILVETAEDETAIISQIQWEAATDQCWGWCGEEGEDHMCSNAAFFHTIGDGENAFENLKDAFSRNKLGTNARVVMLNPLHAELPPMVILMQATCNKFNHKWVREQLAQIRDLYNKHLFHILGPLVGNASDGDARRRKLHLQNALSKDGERYCIDTPNFTMSGKIIDVDGIRSVTDLADQDYIHCGKKVINHLKHSSKTLMLGEYWVHMHHVQCVMDNFPAMTHGLRQSDIDRIDRMNWESAQRLMFPKVRECLEKINSGNGVAKEHVLGTAVFLKMCWMFVEIFQSLTASILLRVQYASCVANMLRIWRVWISRHPTLTLKDNFVSTETYKDIIIACHHTVLITMASRDFAPNHPINYKRTGTNCCEDFFSSNGAFVMNKHNYTILDMYQNLNNMNRLVKSYILFQSLLA